MKFNWKLPELFTILAAASVLLRQTNVIWVGMACACTALDIIVSDYACFKKIPRRSVNILQAKVRFNFLYK